MCEWLPDGCFEYASVLLRSMLIVSFAARGRALGYNEIQFVLDFEYLIRKKL